MGDIEIFYAELSAASSSLDTATSDLTIESGNLRGEDTGVENPAGRTSLRLELHTRLVALRDSAAGKVEAGSDVSGAIHQISDKYSQLDAELTGNG